MAGTLHVVAAQFPTVTLAEDALRAIKDGGVKLADQAIIVRGEDGTLKIKESKDAGGGRGFALGAVATGVLEVLAGPVGWTMLAGGVAGGLVAKFHDAGVPTKSLEALGEDLKPGEAVGLAIANDGDEESAKTTLAKFQGKVVAVAVADSLRTALEEAGPPAQVPA